VENEKKIACPKPEASLAHTHDSIAPKLSVIVPVFNGGLQLSRCLEGLCLSEYSDFEVVVVFCSSCSIKCPGGSSYRVWLMSWDITAGRPLRAIQ
jgi:hypothetical protein